MFASSSLARSAVRFEFFLLPDPLRSQSMQTVDWENFPIRRANKDWMILISFVVYSLTVGLVKLSSFLMFG